MTNPIVPQTEESITLLGVGDTQCIAFISESLTGRKVISARRVQITRHAFELQVRNLYPRFAWSFGTTPRWWKATGVELTKEREG